jgi:hypothetical protein
MGIELKIVEIAQVQLDEVSCIPGSDVVFGR